MSQWPLVDQHSANKPFLYSHPPTFLLLPGLPLKSLNYPPWSLISCPESLGIQSVGQKQTEELATPGLVSPIVLGEPTGCSADLPALGAATWVEGHWPCPQTCGRVPFQPCIPSPRRTLSIPDACSSIYFLSSAPDGLDSLFQMALPLIPVLILRSCPIHVFSCYIWNCFKVDAAQRINQISASHTTLHGHFSVCECMCECVCIKGKFLSHGLLSPEIWKCLCLGSCPSNTTLCPFFGLLLGYFEKSPRVLQQLQVTRPV